MSKEFQIGDYVMLRDDRPADLRSLGVVGQIVDPGHNAPDPTTVYVRVPNGRESWLDRGSLVHAPNQNRS